MDMEPNLVCESRFRKLSLRSRSNHAGLRRCYLDEITIANEFECTHELSGYVISIGVSLQGAQYYEINATSHTAGDAVF